MAQIRLGAESGAASARPIHVEIVEMRAQLQNCPQLGSFSPSEDCHSPTASHCCGVAGSSATMRAEGAEKIQKVCCPAPVADHVCTEEAVNVCCKCA